MNYFIKGSLMVPDLEIKDQTLTIGKKQYPMDKVSSFQIAYHATFATNGVIACIVEGRTLNIAFTKKDAETVRQAVHEVKALLASRYASAAPALTTAKALYEDCLARGFGSGMTRTWGEKHFQIVVDMLQPGEVVVLPFIGLHNYVKVTQHDNNFAYAVTNKRIIMAQQKLIGQTVQTVSWNNVNDITLKKGTVFGIITIDSLKEVFNIAVDRTQAQNIYEELHRALERVKCAPPAASTAGQSAAKTPVEQIKEYKELLDLGILTQEEFDKKKRELLNL